jgi:NAD(P)-dependent dehydrogenase (short-subunit alcohol dehydrogenase family)
VLVANAGVAHFGALDRVSRGEWDWVFSVNLFGVVNTVDAFLPLLRETPGKRQIAITSSGAYLAPGPRIGVYTASKFAVAAYGETLRLELAPEGIGVSLILPGSTDTRLLETSAAARPADLGGQRFFDEDLAVTAATNPHGDVVSPEEAAAEVVPQILADEQFVITHGASREAFRSRTHAFDAAYDRMEASTAGPTRRR